MSDPWLTERLSARRPGPADSNAYLSLFLDREVGARLRPSPLPRFDEGQVLEILDQDAGHWEKYGFGPWVLVEQASGTMIGRGGLRWTDLEEGRAVEAPWTIRSDKWGRGYASEAAAAALAWARSLRLTEVIALVRPDNPASRRVAKKAGFHFDRETVHAGLPHLLFRKTLAPSDTR